MMISPETYYEASLKGKSAEQIITAICGLKREIGRPKNVMEHPEYGTEAIMCPSEVTQLSRTRDYLDRAKLALAEAGVVYKPSQAELKAQEFENNFPSISKIVFSIGGVFNGYETRTYTIDDDETHTDVEHSLVLEPTNVGEAKKIDKAEFMDELSRLHIGE